MTSQNQNTTSRTIAVCVGLVLINVAVYYRAVDYPFCHLDDGSLLYSNPIVTGGLTSDNLRGAFGFETIDWIPLTYVSYMIEHHFFGLDTRVYHITNIVFHVMNTLLVMFVFKLMTGAFWRSAILAALFAIHPLRVESVVWISERKDVLSMFFGLLAIWAYAKYAKGDRPAMWYVLLLFMFLLSLTSKMMLVTLPCALLLLDVWPMNRLRLGQADEQDGSRFPARSLTWLVGEKVPLVLLAIVGSAIRYRQHMNLPSYDETPWSERISNTVYSYGRYVELMFWPRDMAVLYPFMPDVATGILLMIVAIFVVITAVCVWQLRRRPYLAVGWFWFVGTMFPVSGVIQIAFYGMADRYTYVPSIGLTAAVVWLVAGFCARSSRIRTAGAVVAVVVIVAATVVSWIQVGTWKDDETMWKHVVMSTEKNVTAYQNLGAVLGKKRDYYGAIFYYRQGLEYAPRNYQMRTNLANMLQKVGDIDEAILQYEQTIEVKPDYADALNNLGSVLLATGTTARAVELYERAVAIDAVNPLYETNLGLALLSDGEPEKAIIRLRATLARDGNNPNAILFLGRALAATGKNDLAIEHYHRAMNMRKNWPQAHNSLGTLLARIGEVDEAIIQFEKALAIDPQFADARANLAKAKAIKDSD